MDKYLNQTKKKININLNDCCNINDDHKHFKIVSNKVDDKIDTAKDNSKIIHLKDSKIYNPGNFPDDVSKFKIASINESDFNNFFLGFDDPSLKYRGGRKIDNAFQYGEPSNKNIIISNLQTEVGTNNNLNQRIKSIETGESLNDIKESQEYLDSFYNDEVKKIFELLEKEQDPVIKETETKNMNEYLMKAKKDIAKVKSDKAEIKPIIEKVKEQKKLIIEEKV